MSLTWISLKAGSMWFSFSLGDFGGQYQYLFGLFGLGHLWTIGDAQWKAEVMVIFSELWNLKSQRERWAFLCNTLGWCPEVVLMAAFSQWCVSKAGRGLEQSRVGGCSALHGLPFPGHSRGLVYKLEAIFSWWEHWCQDSLFCCV